jgi:hypothetical protein
MALAAVPRLLYTHNPLYLLSALLVLYGMDRVLAAQGGALGGALLMGTLCGYTVLLAVVGYLIVRFGQVWEDARTILLVLVLLLVALSAGFDRVVLDDPIVGARFLLSGLLFVVLVTEGVLRSLRIRPPARYAAPYYLLMILLFCYPIRLGHLSTSGQDAKMAWAVFFSPVAAGMAALTLLPAARSDCRRDSSNGTPWRWPWYPWSLFAALLLATAMRSYSLGMSFETGHGLANSFQPYFLLPLLLAGAALLLELGITARSPKAQAIALTAPAGLLLFALPGHGSSQAAQFVNLLSETIASPAQLTVYGLVLFYAFVWLRGQRWGELGLVACLALAAIVDRQTHDLDTLTAPQWPPLLAIAVAEFGLGIWRYSSWRLMAGVLAAGLTAMRLGWTTNALQPSSFDAGHWGLLALLFLAALCNDGWARFIRRFAWCVIPLAALWVAAEDTLFPEMPRLVNAFYLASVAVLGTLFWYRAPNLQRLAAAVVSVAALLGTYLRWLYEGLEDSRISQGLPWLAWGMGSLAIAISLSLIKAGVAVRLVAFVRMIGNDRTRLRHTGATDDE